jgi:metallophosphoesterase superfamily enzyme
MAVFNFELLAEKALFHYDTGSLCVADVHLGKAGHFRQAGVALPGGHNTKDLNRLRKLIHRFKPALQRVIFLGDIFHSRHNSEWDAFCIWRQEFQSLPMLLVEGNHDILSPNEYSRAGLQVLAEGSVLGKLELRHHPKPDGSDLSGNITMPEIIFSETSADSVVVGINTAGDAPLYLCGHLHPGVNLYGAGRQHAILPCFWQYGHMLMLPAFGSFTGLHRIRPRQGDGIWGIADSEIMALHEV